MGNTFGPTPRSPNQAETSVINNLRTAIQKHPDSAELQTLSECFSISSGEDWKSKLGFQNEDPLKDIRGGGSLAIMNMNYFCGDPRFEVVAKEIAARRSHRDDGENYPFATAGINITRALAVHFEVVTSGGNVKLDLQHSKKHYWELLVSNEGGNDPLGAFNVMFSLFFLLLDSTFTELKAGYMEFPVVLKETQKRFEEKLALCGRSSAAAASLEELERFVRESMR